MSNSSPTPAPERVELLGVQSRSLRVSCKGPNILLDNINGQCSKTCVTTSTEFEIVTVELLSIRDAAIRRASASLLMRWLSSDQAIAPFPASAKTLPFLPYEAYEFSGCE